MNVEARIDRRRGECAPSEFPARTNPNRPGGCGGPSSWPETRGEARPIPAKCDPTRSRRPLTEEQRELATRYMPMARALARQAGWPLSRNDELEAEAYAALVESAQSFDPDRGVNFAVFARLRIVGALRDYRRFLFHATCRGSTKESPLFERLSGTDTNNGRIIGREPESPTGAYFEAIEAVESAIRLLPRSHAVACRMIYLEGKSQDETAQALGYSKGYLSRLHGDAIERLRRDHREALAG